MSEFSGKEKAAVLSANRRCGRGAFGQAGPVIAGSGDEIQLKLQKALLKLPDKQRLVFNMRYFEDMTYEQISEITDTTVGALKASYHHAVKKIEDFLTE